MKFLVQDGTKRYEIPLREGHTVIGRDVSCDVTIQHGQMSRKHMLCIVQGEQIEVQDLGSKNGIHVGGTRIERTALQPGDAVRVGDLLLTLSAETMAGPPGEAMPPPSPPQAAAPPTTGVPEPEADEPTPADDTFVPQEYPVAQQSPQLVARGEKWFVQDSTSGREVEIVPVRQGGEMQPPAPYVQAAPKPSPFAHIARRLGAMSLRRKIMLLVAVVLVLGLGIWAAVELSKEPPPPKKMTRDEYASLVDEAVAALVKGDVKTAQKHLKVAIKGMPSRKIAPALRDLAGIWMPLHSEFSPVRQEAENLLEEIWESDHATSKARTMANREMQWMRKEALNEGRIYDARRYVQQNRWADAAKKFDQVSSDSLFRKTFAKQMQEARDKAIEQFFSAGKKDVADQNWDEAIEHFKSTIAAAGKHAEAEKMIQYCQKCSQAQIQLARAKQAFNQGKADEAARLAAGIEMGTPFDAQAQSLRGQAESQKAYSEAIQTFLRGDGERAMTMLRRLNTPNASQTINRITQVLRHLKEADKAVANDEFRTAAMHWQQVAQLASEPGNWYRSQAEAKLATWKDIAKAKAQQYVGSGHKKLRARNYREARQAYEKARGLDPDQEIGSDDLRGMDRRAQEYYNAGLNLQKANPQKALEKFRLVKELLGPESKFYQNADERIRQIESGR